MTLSLDSEVRRGRLVLWVVALLLVLVLAYVAWQYVGTVVLGLFVYYVTRPVFERIERRVGQRTVAVAISIVVVALPVLLLTAWTGVVAAQGLVGLLETQGFEQLQGIVQPYLNLSEVQEQLQEAVDALLADPSRLTALEGNGIGGVLATLFGSLALLFNAFLHLFIVLVITFYLLRDDRKLAAWGRDTFVPEGGVVAAYFRAVDRDLKNVYFGNILNALVTGLLGAVVYSLLNVVAPAAVDIPQPVLLGLLTGAASLVPVIGMKLVWVPVSLILVVDALVSEPEAVWFPALFAAISVVVIDYIPDQLLRPYVSGRTLHVGAVMLAYVVGPLLFGWYGIFLGPLVLVVVFEFGRIVVPWLVHPDRETTTPRTPDGEPVHSPDETIRRIPAAMLRSEDEPETGPSNESVE